MIKRSPSRSRYGELSGHDAGLTPGKGQREGRRTERGKHSSEKVWTRLRKSLRERIAFIGMPHCRNSLVLVNECPSSSHRGFKAIHKNSYNTVITKQRQNHCPGKR